MEDVEAQRPKAEGERRDCPSDPNCLLLTGTAMDILASRIAELERHFADFSTGLRFAYQYLETDSASSVTKSRMVMEKLLIAVYSAEMGCAPKKQLLGDMLADNQFTRKIERRILARINSIRDMGNLGPHGEDVRANDAARVLDDLCTVLDWHLQRYPQGEKDPGHIHPSYRVWEATGTSGYQLRRAPLPPGCISVSFPHDPFSCGGGEVPAYILSVLNLTSVRRLLDQLYLGFLQDRFPPGSYGSRWVLALDSDWQQRLVVPIDWVATSTKAEYHLSPEWAAKTSLQAAGISAGTDWQVLEASSCCQPLGLAVNDPSIIEIAAENPKAMWFFTRRGTLQKGDLGSVANGGFSHIAVINEGARLLLRWEDGDEGTNIFQEGPVPLTEEERTWWRR
jgi:hypothetical protein